MSESFDNEEFEGYSVSFDCACKCLSYFLEVIDTSDYKVATVDDFFLFWARCVLSVHAVKEKEEDKVPNIEYRKQLGAALQTEGSKIKTYDWAPKRFVNCVNALMNIYNLKCSAKFSQTLFPIWLRGYEALPVLVVGHACSGRREGFHQRGGPTEASPNNKFLLLP